MMMIPAFNSRQGRDRRTWFLVAVVVLLASGVILGPWVRDTLASLLWGATRVASAVPLPRTVLESRLAALEDEVIQTRYQSVLYVAQAERIKVLEAELGLRPQESYLSVAVLAAPPRSHYDTLLLKAGRSEGVIVGDIVHTHGVAIGIVTDVSDATSIAQLFSSPGATRDASIGDTDAILVVSGLGGGALETYAPGELAISVGDTVSDTRSGMVFGVVASIVRREIDTEQYVLIALPVVPSSVSLVSLTRTP